jgi:putative flippase GtrA
VLSASLRAPVVRFAAVGLAMTTLHLVVLRLLLLVVPVPEVANVVAFLCVTQVNFAVSYVWTWSSRRPVGQETVGHVIRRAVLFAGSAVTGFGVNAAVFSVAYRLTGLSPLHSAVAASAVSAVATFLLSSRVVFAGRRAIPSLPAAVEPSAAERPTAVPPDECTAAHRRPGSRTREVLPSCAGRHLISTSSSPSTTRRPGSERRCAP